MIMLICFLVGTTLIVIGHIGRDKAPRPTPKQYDMLRVLHAADGPLTNSQMLGALYRNHMSIGSVASCAGVLVAHGWAVKLKTSDGMAYQITPPGRAFALPLMTRSRYR